MSNKTKSEEVNPEVAEAIDTMLHQLLIVLVARLGNSVVIPAKEIDDTGDRMLAMACHPRTGEFVFEVVRKLS